MQIEINTKSDPGWEHSCVLFATKPPLPSDYQTELSDDNLLFLFCRKMRLRANIVRSALTRFDKWWSNTDVYYCGGSFIGLWLFNTALYCSIICSHADIHGIKAWLPTAEAGNCSWAHRLHKSQVCQVICVHLINWNSVVSVTWQVACYYLILMKGPCVSLKFCPHSTFKLQTQLYGLFKSTYRNNNSCYYTSFNFCGRPTRPMLSASVWNWKWHSHQQVQLKTFCACGEASSGIKMVTLACLHSHR